MHEVYEFETRIALRVFEDEDLAPGLRDLTQIVAERCCHTMRAVDPTAMSPPPLALLFDFSQLRRGDMALSARQVGWIEPLRAAIAPLGGGVFIRTPTDEAGRGPDVQDRTVVPTPATDRSGRG